uniref:translocation protein SEC63 homolog n=1 Tax=Ciona intestinalis TaxID=7719 RepID=UPI000180B801|nr:translocation protein SEC63 homolog [Ciona intestinalis]|eukprot:XP_002126467.1 translocation protein SEC63 homolog [Ciona intestinalis]
MSQQFAYDEKGSTFLYFILSFFAMLLIPLTYLFWPKGVKDEEKRLRTLCPIHGKSKWYKKVQEALRRKKSKPSFRKWLIVFAWVGFLVLVYKVSNIENDHVEYDPYEVLGVDRDADKIEIKKRYRQLSLENHPDKGGDSDTFMKIRKAYESLTDEETMQNWKEYGNPDGPQAMEFGIALPKWIVESKNSIFVLGIYMALFMVIMPIIVGVWWSRSIKYSKEQVLLNTTQLYYYFLNKTPNLNLKRAIMIISASFEFSREHNSKVRAPTPADNEELPDLLHRLESCSITDNPKERPMNFPYSVKARILIYCHLCRLDIPSTMLEEDLEFILCKVPLLVQEMVGCLSQLTVMAHWNKASMPRLESLENVMKICPMMVQGLRETKSPLLQLPYFNDDFVKYCHMSKKRFVRNLRGLAQLRESDRRQMLRRMGDEEYDTMISVLKKYPDVELHVTTQVMDDEDLNVITAGAIVTVTLSMTRKELGDLQEEEAESPVETLATLDDEEGVGEKPNKLKVWEKQSKKKKNVKKKKPTKAGAKKTLGAKKVDKSKFDEAEVSSEGQAAKSNESGDSDSDDSDTDSDSPRDEETEEKEWQAMQATFKRKSKASLTVSDKRTHTVYAPNLPVEKQEWWWVYVCDRKRHLLLTSPVMVCNLRESEEIELKFPAPQKPGRYTYQVWLRSDSYLDCDQKQDIKLDVKEAKPLEEEHPQWNISDNENNDGGNESEDEGISSEENSLSDVDN